VPDFQEDNTVEGGLDVVAPVNVLDAQGIDLTGYFPRIDQLFDDLDSQATGYTSISDFGAVVDQAMANEAAFLDLYLEANKNKPKAPPAPDYVVTGPPRSRGLSQPRLTGGGGGLMSLLSPEERAIVRDNLKLVLPGTTDAEIDELIAQLRNSLSAQLSLARIGTIGYTTVGGDEKITLKVSQARRIIGVLTSLNSTLSVNALNRMTSAIRGGRIRIMRG
jgi:hypothetical protein